MNAPVYDKRKEKEQICYDNMCPKDGGNSAGYAIGSMLIVIIALAIALWYASGLNHLQRPASMSQAINAQQQNLPYPDQVTPPMKSVPVRLK